MKLLDNDSSEIARVGIGKNMISGPKTSLDLRRVDAPMAPGMHIYEYTFGEVRDRSALRAPDGEQLGRILSRVLLQRTPALFPLKILALSMTAVTNNAYH